MLLVDGGMLSLKILEKTKQDVVCEVVDGGTMGSRSHCSAPLCTALHCCQCFTCCFCTYMQDVCPLVMPSPSVACVGDYTFLVEWYLLKGVQLLGYGSPVMAPCGMHISFLFCSNPCMQLITFKKQSICVYAVMPTCCCKMSAQARKTEPPKSHAWSASGAALYCLCMYLQWQCCFITLFLSGQDCAGLLLLQAHD